MVSKDVRTASCACGQLKVELCGQPKLVVVCHCYACQKRTGSPFGQGAYFAKDQIGQIKGAHKTFSREIDGKRRLDNGFCPECGTTVFWTFDLRSEQIAISVGCFEDPAFPGPDRAVWSASRHHWIKLPDDVPQFETISDWQKQHQ